MEFALNSSQRTDGDGCQVKTDEPEFGITGTMFPNNEEDHWYRVVVRILTSHLVQQEVEELDPSFASKLVSANLNVQLYASNPNGETSHTHLATILPPEHLMNKEFWDVGYVNPK